VVRKLVEGKVGQSGVLGAADAVLDPSMATVAGLQVGQVCVWGVGQEDLVAPAVWVEEGEMGTGMRLLPPDDGPGARRPGRQLEQAGELGHLSTFPQLVVLVDGLHP